MKHQVHLGQVEASVAREGMREVLRGVGWAMSLKILVFVLGNSCLESEDVAFCHDC